MSKHRVLSMAGKELNIQLDSYLNRIRGNERDTKRDDRKKEKRMEEISDEDKKILARSNSTSDVFIIKNPKTFWQKLMEKFSTREEEEDFEIKKKKTSQPSEIESEFEQEFEEMVEEEREVGSFWFNFFHFFRRIKFVREENEEIDKAEIMEEEAKIEDNAGEEEFEEDYDEIESKEQNKGFFRRLWESISGPEKLTDGDIESDLEAVEQSSNQIKEEAMKEVVQTQQDMKDVAMITTKLIKKLPVKELNEFKNSEDFENFKSILLKHRIIKVKTQQNEE